MSNDKDTTNGGENSNENSGKRLMDVLEELAGEGRVEVSDRAPEDPRLHLRTPAGDIRIGRTPDFVRREGSARLRAWNFGNYRLEEDVDYQPGLDVNHAVYVKRRGGDEGEDR